MPDATKKNARRRKRSRPKGRFPWSKVIDLATAVIDKLPRLPLPF
jgi:hypothetical protein